MNKRQYANQTIASVDQMRTTAKNFAKEAWLDHEHGPSRATWKLMANILNRDCPKQESLGLMACQDDIFVLIIGAAKAFMSEAQAQMLLECESILDEPI